MNSRSVRSSPRNAHVVPLAIVTVVCPSNRASSWSFSLIISMYLDGPFLEPDFLRAFLVNLTLLHLRRAVFPGRPLPNESPQFSGTHVQWSGRTGCRRSFESPQAR